MEKSPTKMIELFKMVMEMINHMLDTVESWVDPETDKIEKELILLSIREAVGEEKWARIEKWMNLLVDLKIKRKKEEVAG